MDIWKHGRYVDLWSLVHVLTGALLAIGCYGLGYGFWTATTLSFALLIAWELFEWAIRIIEPSMNVAVDIAVGILGFLLGAYWHYFLGHPFDPLAFMGLLAGTLLLAGWGFLDFHFRGYR